MVVKKRTDSGYDGFLVPSIPRAPRSARGKCPRMRKAEESQLCAIELLASIAGKLLLESESSASSNASDVGDLPVVLDDAKLERCSDVILKAEHLDVECCEENVFIPEFDSPRGEKKCVENGLVSAGSESILERSSVVSSPSSKKNVSGGVKSEGFGSSKLREDVQLGPRGSGNRRSSIDSSCSFKDPVELCLKLPGFLNPDNGAKLSPRKEIVHSASVLGHRKNTNLGFRDDDEKFSRDNKPISKLKAFRPSSRINDRRMRKLLTSKYWRSAPKLKDLELPNVEFLDGGVRALHRKRKICYTRERYRRDALYKRRKFSDCSFIVTSDGGFSSESVCNSPEMNISGKKNCSDGRFHGANGVSSTVTDHQPSFLSRDAHVKFSIKSFRVPELLIDVPENATVASLKRTVMEAVTCLVRDGLHVGVLFNGKKVRDDNRTLLQSGITSKEDLGSLGFTLEPTGRSALPPVRTDDLTPLPCPSSCDISKLAPRSPATPVVDTGIADVMPDPPPLTCVDNQVADNHEPVSSHTDIVTDNLVPDSKALVTVPSADVEPLAVVPVTPKSKRSELVQRRTRRPFSVTEVEALVSAVEELGTGRWRDVKLRSFENADHRTYVDLKDKWKTLVHTAKIAPQQRRGEPVPQELLDRVLAAHGFWSQHQGRPSSKNQTAIVKIADGPGDRNGVDGN